MHFLLRFFFFVGLFIFIFTNFSFSQKKLDLNRATFEELESLPGIGPKIAKEIIEYRERFGPFKSLEDLLKIKGIGPKRFEILKKYLKVDKDVSQISEENKKHNEKGSVDIYYYKDEKGIIHYTQFPESVPEKYKNTLKKLE